MEKLRAAELSLKLRRVFDHTHHSVWRQLHRLGMPAAQLENSFAQVFELVAQQLEEIDAGNERSFVTRLVLDVARGVLRHQRRDSRNDFGSGHQLSASALHGRKRYLEVWSRILESLEPGMREAFVLHEMEHLGCTELARILEITEVAVQSRVSGARLLVAAELETLVRCIFDDESLTENSGLQLERELLRAAAEETTPTRARRRVLANLRLLVVLPGTAAGSIAASAGSSLRSAAQSLFDWDQSVPNWRIVLGLVGAAITGAAIAGAALGGTAVGRAIAEDGRNRASELERAQATPGHLLTLEGAPGVRH